MEGAWRGRGVHFNCSTMRTRYVSATAKRVVTEHKQRDTPETLDAFEMTEFQTGPSLATAAWAAANRSASRASSETPGWRGTRIVTPRDADTLNAEASWPLSNGVVADGVYTGDRAGAIRSLKYDGMGSVGGGGLGPLRLSLRLVRVAPPGGLTLLPGTRLPRVEDSTS